MAAGFKKATVTAASVPATQTDFPSYVDLSRLGITTLAEAQSVRVYADSGKVTEWAREIVSATEMHVKIPSLTSTVEIFVDWDGVRADYAVSATYGRNAVWSGYDVVLHMQEDPSGSAPQMVDSTGNGYDGTSAGSMTSGNSVTAKIQKGLDFDATNDKITSGTFTPQNALSFSMWVNVKGYPSSGSLEGVFMFADATANKALGFNLYNNSGTQLMRYTNRNSGTNYQYDNMPAPSTGSFVHLVATQATPTTEPLMYKDGVSQTVTHESTVGTPARISSTLTVGSYGEYTGGFWGNVKADEVRLARVQLSANWITTEYNNQNAESTFWPSWATVGGGSPPTNPAFLLNFM